MATGKKIEELWKNEETRNVLIRAMNQPISKVQTFAKSMEKAQFFTKENFDQFDNVIIKPLSFVPVKVISNSKSFSVEGESLPSNSLSIKFYQNYCNDSAFLNKLKGSASFQKADLISFTSFRFEVIDTEIKSSWGWKTNTPESSLKSFCESQKISDYFAYATFFDNALIAESNEAIDMLGQMHVEDTHNLSPAYFEYYLKSVADLNGKTNTTHVIETLLKHHYLNQQTMCNKFKLTLHDTIAEEKADALSALLQETMMLSCKDALDNARAVASEGDNLAIKAIFSQYEQPTPSGLDMNSDILY